jgi:hypothetical protein
VTEKTINRNKQREMQTFPCPFLFIQVLLKYFNSLSLFPQELELREVNGVKSLRAVAQTDCLPFDRLRTNGGTLKS